MVARHIRDAIQPIAHGTRGHLFHERYKSLLVDPAAGLGPLCHYIHLPAVRARVRRVAHVPVWPWSSLRWLMTPELRPAWYAPGAALDHAGGLSDTPAGRPKYLEYLGRLSEDEPARKAQRFAEMSGGWVIGTAEFAKAVVRAHTATLGRGRRMAAETRVAHEALWWEALEILLRKLGRPAAALASEGKSVERKVALAATLKTRTTATNRWLNTALHLGNRQEVSRKAAAWRRVPDKALCQKLGWKTQNPNA